MTDVRAANNDLVLAPGEFAYVQSTTNGDVRINVGPSVITQAGNDRPVMYNTKSRRFDRCSLEQAVQVCTVANEGDYIVLENPAKENKHPTSGANTSIDLLIGRRVMIPGPASFALFPGQSATVIPGHQLRSNQYVLCCVYNEEEAITNWTKTVAKGQVGEKGDEGDDAEDGETKTLAKDIKVGTLVQGQLFIIKGTDVSFYIPPTGVEVIQDEEGKYVRNAVTLEQLEYAILNDENGSKRYERGPQVVFPKPTERFQDRSVIEDGESKLTRRFRAIELNSIQGVHLKVIAPFEEEFAGKKVKREVGEEYFVIGAEQAIFYPRPELSIVTYGEGTQKHFATAVPAGEARYVLDRRTSEINTVVGPTMLLPDPINEVQARRILTSKQVELWYPGNVDAATYNQILRDMSAVAPRGKSGMITETEYSRHATNFSGFENISQAMAFSAPTASAGGATHRLESFVPQPKAASAMTETFDRGKSFTPPRQVVIDSRFEGAPSIGVWTGYAVLVVSKTGGRRVVVGPDNVILDYNETLEVLSLSTGKPKNTDKLQETVYLRVKNNKVSDYISVETSDHVALTLKLSYQVNFDGESKEDQEAWFAVENYVKFLCDHVRSILKGNIRKIPIEEFYADSTAIIRTNILGEPDSTGDRSGMLFDSNGMRITDVEVLGVEIKDAAVTELLTRTQGDAIKQSIDIGQAKRGLEIIKQKEEIVRQTNAVTTATKLELLTSGEILTRKTRIAAAETAVLVAKLDQDQLDRELAMILAKHQAKANDLAKASEIKTVEEGIVDISHTAKLARLKIEADQAADIKKRDAELDLKKLEAEVEAVVKKFTAIAPGFSAALTTLSNNDTVERIAESLSIQNALGGGDLAETIRLALGGILGDTRVTELLARLGGQTAITKK